MINIVGKLSLVQWSTCSTHFTLGARLSWSQDTRDEVNVVVVLLDAEANMDVNSEAIVCS